ncbi:C40 family peptidase [Fertoebacter nigrum]|uniref:C40 family peptidase n=1 Tax=Fertoeibacter niger TaxID=2656921 RepID=A0A8X8H7B9_9RHOB|nr:NlpC/P60 family protein [Fertoeibacter niger]NUB44671.1 C40 family peptidase [Fertoeibacter niger]
MDSRLTPATARVAHESLRGRVEAARYTPGEVAEVVVPLADLLAAPDGARDRQVLLGDGFTVIDREHGFAFGQAAKDGYCGWLRETVLGPPVGPTHWVAAPASHIYRAPRVQAQETASLSLGARVRVTGTSGAFAETPLGFVPSAHLRPIGDWFTDPVDVAHQFLGSPYLWGGNSRAGLDCSGLVQAALLACGWPCPADSDLQLALGQPVDQTGLMRGDLIFWKGHVAMIVDGEMMIHATAHGMTTRLEPTARAIARIAAQGGGPVTACRRP